MTEDAVLRTLLRTEQERDGAYRERAYLVAWLASIYQSVIAPATDVDEPGWQIVYVYACWQMSWHISPGDADLFEGIEHVAADDPRAQWDGHTTEQKYDRIAEHAVMLRQGSGNACAEMHHAALRR